MTIVQLYPTLKAWPKEAGPKPTKKLLEEASVVARPGSKDAVAVAMTLRDEGATQKQIAVVLGGPHRNKIRDLIVRSKARRIPIAPKGGHMVYKLHLKKSA